MPGKPKILFLHGGGTNAEIFRLQARKLITLLKTRFDLVFPDGPEECEPGPGIMPIFAGCEPFRRWMNDVSKEPNPDELDWANGIALLTKDVLSTQGPFVGVIGFSQGAKAAMHLLRYLEKKEKAGAGRNPFKFMVSVCGTSPFDGLRDGGKDVGRAAGFKESVKLGRVATPSLHMIASDDPWRPESETLVEFFEVGTRAVVGYKGDHIMPKDDGVNQTVADFVFREFDDAF